MIRIAVFKRQLFTYFVSSELWSERVMLYYVENVPGAWANQGIRWQGELWRTRSSIEGGLCIMYPMSSFYKKTLNFIARWVYITIHEISFILSIYLSINLSINHSVSIYLLICQDRLWLTQHPGSPSSVTWSISTTMATLRSSPAPTILGSWYNSVGTTNLCRKGQNLS